MAKDDTPVECLNKTARDLARIQTRLKQAGSEHEDLLLGLISLKEKVIKRYESIGGTWQDRRFT